MRVLHLNTDGWFEREGIARSVQAIVSRLDCESHLVAPAPTGEMFAGLHAVDAPPARSPWAPAMVDVVAKVRPDVVHIHGGEAGCAMAYGSAFAGLPVVVTICGAPSEVPPLLRHPLRTARDVRSARVRLGRRLAISAVGLHVSRQALRRGRVKAICTPDERIVAALRAAGPVLLARGGAAPSPHQAQWSADPVIAFAGRAEAARGVDDLIAALPLVRRTLPGATLRLHLLPGRSLEQYQDLAVPGLEVHVGAVGDLEARLATAQVAVVPFRMSLTLTPALVASEAMSVGLPVVVSDVACLRPLVRDGHNGFVVPPHAPAAIARAVCRAVGDPTRWSALSAGARDTIESDWGWDAAAASVAHAYDLALSPTGHTRAAA